MWAVGVLRTLKNCNSRTILHFNKYSELHSAHLENSKNYKRVTIRKFVSSVYKDLSYSQARCTVVRRMLLTPPVNYTNTREMAIDVESIPPPYEYIDPQSEEEEVNVTFIYPDGTDQKVRGKVGDNLLLLALRHGVNIEGACEAQLACTSCHVYVDEKYEEYLEEKSEEEDDLLDNAPFLKENSRLGCQIILKKELDGLRLTVPKATVNFYVDGHVPKH